MFRDSRVATFLLPLTLWFLCGVFVITVSAAQTPCSGWSLESAVAERLDSSMYMYDFVPPGLSLAAESSGDWHLAFRGDHCQMYESWAWWDDITYLSKSGLSTQLASTRESDCSQSLSNPAVAVDSSDVPAVAYGILDWMTASWSMYLVTNPGLPETTVEKVITGLPMYESWMAPDPGLCFDPWDDWHVTYATTSSTPGGTESKVYHVTETASEVVASSLLFYGAEGWDGWVLRDPSISADLDGNLSVAFVRSAPDQASTVELVDNRSGSWSLPQTLYTLMADNVEFYEMATPPTPSLVIDDVANWHLACADGYRSVWPPYEEVSSVMLATSGEAACSIADGMRIYEPDGWSGDWVGPASLARDAAGGWHLAYARSQPYEQSWWSQGDWSIQYLTKGLPGGFYWCHIAGPSTLAPGDAASYTISYGVSVSDPSAYDWPAAVNLAAALPEFMWYVSDTSGLPGTAGSHEIEWETWLMPDESHTFALTVQVPPDAASDLGTMQLAVTGEYLSPGSSAISVAVARPEVDLSVGKSVFGALRPGFYSTYYITTYNSGNAAAPDVWVADWLPSELEFESCSAGGVYDADTHSVTWTPGAMGAWTWKTFTVTVRTPVELPLGTNVLNDVCVGSASPWESKYGNNCYTLASTVVGSWDPNEKTVSPAGSISAGERLTYFVEFENEGTAEAINVRVVDFLEPSLDDRTLAGLGAEATYNATTREITWEFPEINLQPGASRVLSFSVCTLGGLDAGTEIENQADVYFDFNPPISTPAVVNVIGGGALQARLFLTPRVLNARSRASTVMGRVEVDGDYSVADIDVESLRLIPGNLHPLSVEGGGDGRSGERRPFLVLTFSRPGLQSSIPDLDPVTIALTGSMEDGTAFVASDSIRVIGF